MTHAGIIKIVASHLLLFFAGYWLAGGCEYKPDRINKVTYQSNIAEIEKRFESNEDRLRNLEDKVGIEYKIEYELGRKR